VLGAGVSATADHWVVADDSVDAVPNLTANSPARAFAFDGAGAPQPVAFATFATLTPGNRAELTHGWNSVTIPSGGTVAFVHFGAEQLSRDAAGAAASRLVSLPPEALTGLSADETAWIRNFVVPQGGSTVAALPSIDGAIAGLVLQPDGVTPAQGTTVFLKSANAFFGRTLETT